MSEQLTQLVRNTREIERQKYREELRIRAALAVLPAIIAANGQYEVRGNTKLSFEYADAFIEELERRG